MSSCENCGKTGIDPNLITIAERGPGGEKILIGPCCIMAPITGPQMSYHLEFSSQNGFVAQMEYNGLRVEYRKSAHQLRQAFAKREEVQEESHAH